MRTLADIRRRMTPGTRLICVEQTKLPGLVGTVREVVKNGSTVARMTIGEKSFRFEWPKSQHVRILDADTWEYDLVSRDGTKYGTVRLRFLSTELDQCSTCNGKSNPDCRDHGIAASNARQGPLLQVRWRSRLMAEMTLRYVHTGEVRPPRAGEWFRGARGGEVRARFDFTQQSFEILREVFEPVQREVED